MLLSIIIPFYNTQAYISRCIESLYHQGLKESVFEVILVNDGSTDSSMQICESFASDHSNIKIITQHNQGLSVSRNVGINEANGKYICFVDSDDFLAADGLSKVVPYCEEHPDIIRYWCKLVYNDNQPVETAVRGEVTFCGKGFDYIKKYGLETFCWNYLFKKEFLLSNSLSFYPGIKGEDFRFMADVFFKNPTVVSLSHLLYNYMIREGSISTSKNIANKRQWVTDFLDTIIYIKGELKSFRLFDEVLYSKGCSSLQGRMPRLFSLILDANLSKTEFKEIMALCQKEGFLPIEIHHQVFSRKERQLFVICNTIYTYPLFYHLASLLYRKVYAPHIHRYLNRNN